MLRREFFGVSAAGIAGAVLPKTAVAEEPKIPILCPICRTVNSKEGWGSKYPGKGCPNFFMCLTCREVYGQDVCLELYRNERVYVYSRYTRENSSDEQRALWRLKYYEYGTSRSIS